MEMTLTVYSFIEWFEAIQECIERGLTFHAYYKGEGIYSIEFLGGY